MRFDLPSPEADTQPFWDAAREHRLVVMRDRASGRHFFYPRPFAPDSWNDEVEWVEVSGRASLYTFSIVRENDLPPWPERVPYVAAIVELEEGPRLMTNVVECKFDDLEVGMPLQVTWRALDDHTTVPVFRPTGLQSPTA